MHKILISTVISCSTLFLSGCESFYQAADYIPESASRLSLMYRPDIQQGSVVDQEMVNKLKPGMSKRQVSYLLGTPALIDSFHQNRWDYVYSLKKNRQERIQKDLTLFFENDRLTRIEGDYRPVPVNEMAVADRKETVVEVPDYVPEDRGIIEKALDTVGLETKEK